METTNRRGGNRRRPLVTCTASWSVVWLMGMLMASGCTAPPDPGNTNTNDNDNSPNNPLARTCIGCHTDETLLRQVAREEPPPVESSGEG